MNATDFTGSRLWSIVSTSLIVLLCAVVMGLTLEVRALRPQARELQRRKVMPVPGMFLPTVRAATSAGDSVTVGETVDGRSQVLMYFSTTCEFCRATLPNWRRLSDALLADSLRRFDVFWVSMSSRDSTNSYLKKHNLRYPVIYMPNWKINRLTRVNGVPLTLVADRYGRIVHTHASVIRSRIDEDSVMLAAFAAVAPVAPPRTGTLAPR